MNPDKHQNALNQNDRLHWYEIKSILGHGGFGITYLAHDTNLNHEVAIKEYLPGEFSTRNAKGEVQPITEEWVEVFEWGRSRFLEESRTLFQFKHDNIVRVLSAFEANNTGYMVMEYVQGTDFSDLIKAGAIFSENKLLEIIIPILDGLELVHDRGFIHRDIKPQNIVLRNDGCSVLIDFGSARQAMGAQTHTLTTLVTPGYTPLEQYHEEVGEQGPWTDIYAIGATLYAAITGDKPADALKRSATKSGKKPDAYQRLSGVWPGDYSEHFLAAIDHALEFAARDRPQSLGEWSKMLQGIEPVPGADPLADINPGRERDDDDTRVPVSSPNSLSNTLPPAASKKHSRIIPASFIVLVLLGSYAYLQWDSIQPLLNAAIEDEAADEQSAQKMKANLDADPAGDEIAQKLISAEAEIPNPEEDPARQASAAGQQASSGSIPRPMPDIDADISGSYVSELTYTNKAFGVDEHWYFGEPPELRVEMQQIGNQVLGLVEGSRSGRIKGTLRGNEILFAFNLVDPDGNTNQGKGSWFVARNGEKMIGKWSLVNASDGSEYLEGNWKLTRLE